MSFLGDSQETVGEWLDTPVLKRTKREPFMWYPSLIELLMSYRFLLPDGRQYNWWSEKDHEPDGKWIPAAHGNALTFNAPQ